VQSGLPPETEIVEGISALQHANLRWTFGPAGRVLASPAYHRLHHSAGLVLLLVGEQLIEPFRARRSHSVHRGIGSPSS
jgi:hypothetical protein